MLNDSADTKDLEKVPFTKRIPIGMYAFTYLEEDGMDISYQVMVYDSTAKAYENMMKSLPELFASFGDTNEYIPQDELIQMAHQCRDTFFLGEMIPPYDERDIINILKYYAQYETAPTFYTFDDLDKSKIDVCKIAKYIVDNKMDPDTQSAYVRQLWDDGDENILRLFFGRQKYFLDQLYREIIRLIFPLPPEENGNVTVGKKKLEDMTLIEIRKINPEYEKELRDAVFAKATDEDGMFTCALCGKKFSNRIMLQVDHIKPMNKGGKTILDNLQVLCRVCNGEKGDK